MSDLSILCLDFDGVIHRYSKGWHDGSIYDGMTEGFLEWALAAMKHFRLVVYSSRSKEPGGTLAMARWMAKQAADIGGWQVTDLPNEPLFCLRLLQAWRAEVLLFYFAREKPPAFLTIDDRCVLFEGQWGEPALDPDELRRFKPWNAC